MFELYGIVLLSSLTRIFASPPYALGTGYPNATITAAPSLASGHARNSSCAGNCTRPIEQINSIYWSPISITATFTAATVLHIVNPKNQSTRTTTIIHESLDLKSHPAPTDTNSAGTRTTKLTSYDMHGRTSIYATLTFPTGFFDYPSTYTLWGTIPTTVSGTSTCLRIPSGISSAYPTGSVFTFPSHPVLPTKSDIYDSDVRIAASAAAAQASLDPKGWTFKAEDGALPKGQCDYYPLIQPLIPDVGMWGCQTFGACAAADVAAQTALFLTHTSTSTEGGSAEPEVTPADATDSSPAADSPTATPPPDTSTPTAAPETSEAQADSAQPVETASTPANSGNSNPVVQSNGELSPEAISALKVPNNPPQTTPAPEASGAGSAGNTNSANEGQGANEGDSPPAIQSNGELSPEAVSALKVSNASPQGTSAPENSGANSNSGNGGQGDNASPENNGSPNNAGQGSPEGSEGNKSPSNGDSGNGNGAQSQNAPSATVTTTNAQGSQVTNIVPVTIVPVPITTTNNEGKAVVTSSLSTAAATASADTVITSINAAGSTNLVTSQVPAVVLTSTNAQGSQIITTSPIAPPSNNAVDTTNRAPIVIEGHTLAPGSSLVIGSGTSTTPVALQTSNGRTQLVIGSSTSILPPAATPPPIIPQITVGGQTVTPNAASQYIISGQTLAPGSPITLPGTSGGSSSTVVSIATTNGNTELVIGSSTSTISPATTPPPALTVGSSTISANEKGDYIVAGQTLTPGGEATVSGTVVSLGPGGTDAVVGSSTEFLGSHIMGGFGGGANETGAATFKGAGVAAKRRSMGLGVSVAVGSCFVVGLGLL